MQVQMSKVRTPDEEYEYLWNRLGELGDFLAWEVHPNVVKADNVTEKRLWKKLKKLVDSEEYKYYNPIIPFL